jgi:predicted SnoaL-like aldol condensation-catalyzing enzyme
MKTRTACLFVASALASFALWAQEPVMGVKDPESLFKASDPKLNKNKQAALHIERELIQCGQWDRVAEWLTPAYHQHNPNAQTGRDAVVYFFTKVLGQKRTDSCPALTGEYVVVMAEGDYVTVLTPRHLPKPGSQCEQEMRKPLAERGKCADNQMFYTTWFDTWRFVDGKADEHWDNALIEPPAPPPPPK